MDLLFGEVISPQVAIVKLITIIFYWEERGFEEIIINIKTSNGVEAMIQFVNCPNLSKLYFLKVDYELFQ